MSFYNTYRPDTFEEIDNLGVQKTLSSLLTKNKEQLPHAFLFTGSRGTGKTTAARLVAKLFNCTAPQTNGQPCGACDMCISIAKGSAMDVLEIDAASNTGVDNIRDLKDKIMLAPVIAKWKIYIIDEVHMLSTGAFNALLKTLEEPPVHTVFILATTDPHKVPETIKSRCVHITFKKPEQEEIIHALQRIITHESLDITDEALKLLADAADGSFRDAVKFLEQVSLSSTSITKDIVTASLQTSRAVHVDAFIQALVQGNTVECLLTIEAVQKDGGDIKQFFSTVLRTIQKHLIESVMTSAPDSTEYTRMLDILHRYYADLRGTNFPEITLQLAVLNIHNKKEPPTKDTHTPSPVQQKTVTPKKPLAQTSYQTASVSKPPVTPQAPSQTPPAETKTTHTIPLDAVEFTTPTLNQYWNHIIDEVKKIHHGTAGVLRSAKPQEVKDTTLILTTAYAFHRDKLSEPQAKDAVAGAIKNLFGKTVTITVVLSEK
jgi:DNA polymerase III subunit gamma/tau